MYGSPTIQVQTPGAILDPTSRRPECCLDANSGREREFFLGRRPTSSLVPVSGMPIESRFEFFRRAAGAARVAASAVMGEGETVGPPKRKERLPQSKQREMGLSECGPRGSLGRKRARDERQLRQPRGLFRS